MSVIELMVVYKNFLNFMDVVPHLCTFMKPIVVGVKKRLLKSTEVPTLGN